MPRAVVLSHDWIAHELGHLGPWLEAHGFAVTRITREQPRSLPEADLLIVLGSPGSVAGPTCPPAARAEVKAIGDWVRQDRPYLGICFGAQVLARAMGGSVTRMPVPFADYGAMDVVEGAPPALAGPWVTWHNDGITAPVSSTRLGSHDRADLAFRVRRAWGLQPHVEVTAPVLGRMLDALGVPAGESAAVVGRLQADGTNAVRAAALLDAALSEW